MSDGLEIDINKGQYKFSVIKGVKQDNLRNKNDVTA